MKRIVLCFISIILLSSLAFALPGTKSWKAVWNDNTEADLAGYYLYWRAESEAFNNTRRVDCGLISEHSLSAVPVNNYIAVTAYDNSDNEGGFSSELFFDKDTVAPASVNGLAIVAE